MNAKWYRNWIGLFISISKILTFLKQTQNDSNSKKILLHYSNTEESYIIVVRIIDYYRTNSISVCNMIPKFN